MKIRFSIFNRDDFTCQYCGRKAPEVVLEVDHIIPKAEGGSDDIQNLITSCYECNRGKGKELLSKVKTNDNIARETELLIEKELQLKEYYRIKNEADQRKNKEIDELAVLFFGDDEYTFGDDCNRSIKYFLTIFTKDKIEEAISISLVKFPRQNIYEQMKRFSYMCGILHNWRKKNGR